MVLRQRTLQNLVTTSLKWVERCKCWTSCLGKHMQIVLRHLFSRASQRCWTLWKITVGLENINTADLMVTQSLMIDRFKLMTSRVKKQRRLSSWYLLEQEGLVWISWPLIPLSCMTLTGIHRWISKQWIELIELVKQSRSEFTDSSPKTPWRKKWLRNKPWSWNLTPWLFRRVEWRQKAIPSKRMIYRIW